MLAVLTPARLALFARAARITLRRDGFVTDVADQDVLSGQLGARTFGVMVNAAQICPDQASASPISFAEVVSDSTFRLLRIVSDPIFSFRPILDKPHVRPTLRL